ncbi:MAG: DNA polymerase III subunit gamma/tau [Christensenellaceae bacterium]|nr:DNA polymerase III subunit gamma/tau [Christensenellaceae bacterium]
MASLYRKYRPQVFEEVIGQDPIIRTLTNQLKTDSVSHAYVFTGTRGTGKTTTARIFAKAVNCEHITPSGSPCGKCPSCLAFESNTTLDILEFDAASNSGVDNIRAIVESTQYRPSAKYKVYIIDEAHALTSSNQSFNALLKTLEEPPEYVIFILATTEVHKLPQTILSRAMRFDFRFVPTDLLKTHVLNTFKREGIPCSDAAAEAIAIRGEGSVRDSLSISDMCLSYSPGKITENTVAEVLGLTGFKEKIELLKAVLSGDITAALKISYPLTTGGKNIATITAEIGTLLTDIISYKNTGAFIYSVSKEEKTAAAEIAKAHSNYRLSHTLDVFLEVETVARYSSAPHIIFNAAIVRAVHLRDDDSLTGVLERLRIAENKLADAESKLENAAHCPEAAPQRPVIQQTAKAPVRTSDSEKYDGEDAYYSPPPPPYESDSDMPYTGGTPAKEAPAPSKKAGGSSAIDVLLGFKKLGKTETAGVENGFSAPATDGAPLFDAEEIMKDIKSGIRDKNLLLACKVASVTKYYVKDTDFIIEADAVLFKEISETDNYSLIEEELKIASNKKLALKIEKTAADAAPKSDKVSLEQIFGSRLKFSGK